jgi:hypothetical protein
VSSRRPPRPVVPAFIALAGALAAYAVALATGTGRGLPQDALYFIAMGAACGLCAWRGALGADPLVWLLFAAALFSWIAGDVYFTLAGEPALSVADVGYLGFYALALPALVVLLRRTASGTLGTLWADGWVAALTVASVAACFFVEPVLAGVDGADLATVLVNLAYPVADATLLAFVVGAAVATRGRSRSSWIALSTRDALGGGWDLSELLVGGQGGRGDAAGCRLARLSGRARLGWMARLRGAG